MYVRYAIDPLKQKENLGFVVDGFMTNVKNHSKKQLKNTHMKHTTSVKKTRNRSN